MSDERVVQALLAAGRQEDAPAIERVVYRLRREALEEAAKDFEAEMRHDYEPLNPDYIVRWLRERAKVQP